MRGHKTAYTDDGDTSRNKEVNDRLGNKTAYEGRQGDGSPVLTDG